MRRLLILTTLVALLVPAGAVSGATAAPVADGSLTIRSIIGDGGWLQEVHIQQQVGTGPWTSWLDTTMTDGAESTVTAPAGRYRVERTVDPLGRVVYGPPVTVAPGGAATIVVARAGIYTRDVGAGPGDDLVVLTAAGATRRLTVDRAGVTGGSTLDTGFRGMRVVIAGDADLDGRTDLYARDASGRLWFFAADPAGGWRAGRSLGTGWNAFTRLVAPGDFTGDGIPDLLAQAKDGSVRLYAGTGVAGRLTKKGIVARGWNSFSDVAAVGDWNGDSAVDVVALVAGRLRLIPGNGVGGWGTAVTLSGATSRITGVVGVGRLMGSPSLLVLSRIAALPSSSARVGTIYTPEGARGLAEQSVILSAHTYGTFVR